MLLFNILMDVECNLYLDAYVEVGGRFETIYFVGISLIPTKILKILWFSDSLSILLAETFIVILMKLWKAYKIEAGFIHEVVKFLNDV